MKREREGYRRERKYGGKLGEEEEEVDKEEGKSSVRRKGQTI